MLARVDFLEYFYWIYCVGRQKNKKKNNALTDDYSKWPMVSQTIFRERKYIKKEEEIVPFSLVSPCHVQPQKKGPLASS